MFSFRTLTLLCLTLWVAAVPAMAAFRTPSGTAISNVATINYRDANGNVMPTVLSNTVTTVVSQIAAVDVSPTLAAGSNLPGGRVNYSAAVTNAGNGSDILALSASGLPSGWTAAILRDDNGNGVLDSGETTVVASTGLVAQDTVFRLIVQVTIPVAAAVNDTGSVTLLARSGFSAAQTASGVFTTTVMNASVAVTKSASPANPRPGETVTYTIAFQASGSNTCFQTRLQDAIPAGTTYRTGSLLTGPAAGSATGRSDAADGDGADFNGTTAGKVTLDAGDLAPGTGGVFIFQVTLNSGLVAGGTVANIAQATFENPLGTTRGPIDSNLSSVTVAGTSGVTLQGSATKTANPGDTVRYALTLTNNGNAADLIELSKASSQGSAVSLHGDLNGNGALDPGEPLLADTDGDGTVDAGSVGAGQTVRLLASLTVQTGAVDRAVDTITVTAISSNDATARDTATLITTITAPSMTAAKVVSPAGTQPPGAVLTYTITYTNNGTGRATAVVVTDQIPSFTTFVPGSLKLDGNALTDQTDADPGVFTGTAVNVQSGSLGPGASGTVAFQSRIN